MNERIARWSAWAVVVAYFLLAAAGLTLLGLSGASYAGIPFFILPVVSLLVGVWPVTGALIISRHPHHPIGWLLNLGLIAGAVELFAAGVVAYDSTVFTGSLPAVNPALVWLKFGGYPWAMAAFSLILLLFPNGRPHSTGGRIAARMVAGSLLLYLFLKALEPGPVVPLLLPARINPIGVSNLLWDWLRPLMWAALGVLYLCLAAAIISIVLRLRRAQGDERQQIKWMICPASFFLVILLLVELRLVDSSSLMQQIGIILSMIALSGMAIATAFAIFKYRLYDIDILINRTLVYGALTVCIAGLYGLIVGGAGLVIQANLHLASLLITIMLAGVIAWPLRGFLQRSMDRLMFASPGSAAISASQQASPGLRAILRSRVAEGSRPRFSFASILAWLLVGIYFLLAGTGIFFMLLADRASGIVGVPVILWIVLLVVIGIFPVIGALIVTRYPRNPVGWLLFATFPMGAIAFFAIGYAFFAISPQYGPRPIPGVIIFVLTSSMESFALVTFTLMNLLFPSGKLLSSRWRIAAVVAVFTLPVYLVLNTLHPGQLSLFPELINPYGVTELVWAGLEPWFIGAGILLLGCSLVSVGSLFQRLRQAQGDERQQIKWLIVPAVLYWLSLLVDILVLNEQGGILELMSVVLAIISVPLIVIAVAFAIFKYRLYDIDLLINRTLVYGALTGSIATLYILLVGAFGALFQSGGNLIVALVMTGLVAVLFQPLRARLQRGVNRLMYGDRDEPFDVLRRLGQSLEHSGMPEDVLHAIVETVCQTLKLPYAEVSLQHRGAFERAAAYGKHTIRTASFTILYQGDTVGHLTVGLRGQGEPLGTADEGLLRQIARQAGPVARTLQLTRELRQSRAWLVTAREEERRRLRRDLHDGLGPVLASQGLKIAAVSHLLETDPQRARKLLDELSAQNESTVIEIRRLVYALRPPKLDELGLFGAIREYAAGMDTGTASEAGLTIDVQLPEEEFIELPAAIELAAFRIAAEALTNVARHAQAGCCTVTFTLRKNGGGRIFQMEIADDGIGLPENRKAGVGMSSMRERTEEMQGKLQVMSHPQQGTRIIASFPLVG